MRKTFIILYIWSIIVGYSQEQKEEDTSTMEQNFNVFDFQLSAEDMSQIATLDTQQTLFASHRDPAFVEMILQYGN